MTGISDLANRGLAREGYSRLRSDYASEVFRFDGNYTQIYMDKLVATIRPLGKDDADQWWKVRHESLVSEPYAFVASVDDGLPPRGQVERFLCDGFPERCVFGAFAGATMVGILKLERKMRVKLHHKGTLSGGYVTEEVRRRGIARRLVRCALLHAATLAGLEEVQVIIDPTNFAARSLCGAFRFESFGVERRALRVGTKYSD